jgi:hypothetical protein
MTTVPGAPTFYDQAENGKIKFYGLHEMQKPFESMQDEIADKFLPDNVKKHYRKFLAHKAIDQLCHLGMFEANPHEIVVAIAFAIEAIRAYKAAYPESALRYPESKTYWEAQNTMFHALSDYLAPILEADSMAVFHKIYLTTEHVLFGI